MQNKTKACFEISSVLDLFTLQCEINLVKKGRCFVILLKKCRVMFCEH